VGILSFEVFLLLLSFNHSSCCLALLVNSAGLLANTSSSKR